MKIIIFILVILFAILYAHSEDIDSAYADYCIFWKKETEPNLLLVKRNYDLKPIPLKPIKSVIYNSSQITYFELIDESGRNFLFSGLGNLGGGSSSSPIMRQPEIQVFLPINVFEDSFEARTKKDLLPFKNKVVNAYTENNVRCYMSHTINGKPDIDTTYRYNFRVKIIGDCTNVGKSIEFIYPLKSSFILWRVQFKPRQNNSGFSVKIDSVLKGDFFTNQEWLFFPFDRISIYRDMEQGEQDREEAIKSFMDTYIDSSYIKVNTNYLILAEAYRGTIDNSLNIYRNNILLDTPKNRKYLSKKWDETTIIYKTKDESRTIINTNNIFDFLH